MQQENGNIDIRIQILGLLFALAMVAVMGRFWEVMVTEAPKWTQRLRGNSQLVVRIPAPRGAIRDRNGLALVENRANFELAFYLPDIVDAYRKERGSVPVRNYEALERGMVRKKNEADIVQIVNESVIPALVELGLAQDYSSRRLIRHYRQQLYVPYPYLQNVEFSVVAKIAERALEVPGVDISIYPARHYLYGAFAAHLLGYVGPLRDHSQEADLGQFHTAGYKPDDVGLANIEKLLDPDLRGIPGRRVLQRNVKGVIEGEVERVEPVQGNDVCLTIDARIQAITEKVLRTIGRGAAVVVDPRNGDILAMASVPSFDPNMFIPQIRSADWKALLDDPTHPLTNRALLAFPPGSTFKIPIALAGILKGLGPRTLFTCTGSVTYGNKAMKCWIADKGGAHGTLGLVEAIKRSCNAYFYQYGNAAGIENIKRIGEALGLGQVSGLGFEGESPGILPDPEWLATHYPRERWSAGYTANTSIGQGFVLASPLQMAMVTATVANGGLAFTPRIVNRVIDRQGNVVRRDSPHLRADLRTMGITAEQIEIVRVAMREVVNGAGGTASAARVKGVTVAGKTGTAQVWRINEQGVRVKDNHTWFIAFAPYENPTLALCVLVANAHAGGAVSAPIAGKIIEESLALERGYSPEITRLDPAPGNFKFYQAISFDKNVPSQFAGDDEETADHTENAAPAASISTVRSSIAEPGIAEEADEQGRVKKERKGLLRNFFRTSRDQTQKAKPDPSPERERPRRGLFR